MIYYKSPGGEVFAYETEQDLRRFGAADLQRLTDAQYQAHISPADPLAGAQALMTSLIQQRLDAFAQSRSYDNILSACTYASSAVPKFKSDALICIALRDATWVAAGEILSAVQAGARPVPGTLADIAADLPPLIWP
jgi:hypothetical protein